MEKKTLLAFDNIGMSLSFLCAIHCMILPVIAFLPFLALPFLYDPTVERVFVIFSVLFALTSLLVGYWKHKKSKVLKIYGIVAAVLILGAFTHNHNELEEELSSKNYKEAPLAHTSKEPTYVSTHLTGHHHSHEVHEHAKSSQCDHDHAHDHSSHDHSAHDHASHDHSGHDHSGDYSRWLLLVGGIGLMFCHFLNRKLCQACPAHDKEKGCSGH